MRFILPAALLLLAAVPAAATEWTPDGAEACRVAKIGLKLTPGHQGNTMYFEEYARQGLYPAEGDFALQVNWDRAKSGGPEASSAFFVLPNEGVYTDGTAALSVKLDGKPVAARPRQASENYGSVRLVQWQPADDAAWRKALMRGIDLQVDFVDDAGKVLRTRKIDAMNIELAEMALIESMWRCGRR